MLIVKHFLTCVHSKDNFSFQNYQIWRMNLKSLNKVILFHLLSLYLFHSCLKVAHYGMMLSLSPFDVSWCLIRCLNIKYYRDTSTWTEILNIIPNKYAKLLRRWGKTYFLMIHSSCYFVCYACLCRIMKQNPKSNNQSISNSCLSLFSYA